MTEVFSSISCFRYFSSKLIYLRPRRQFYRITSPTATPQHRFCNWETSQFFSEDSVGLWQSDTLFTCACAPSWSYLLKFADLVYFNRLYSNRLYWGNAWFGAHVSSKYSTWYSEPAILLVFNAWDALFRCHCAMIMRQDNLKQSWNGYSGWIKSTRNFRFIRLLTEISRIVNILESESTQELVEMFQDFSSVTSAGYFNILKTGFRVFTLISHWTTSKICARVTDSWAPLIWCRMILDH